DLNENTVVATDGGRFDVNVVGRLRIPVYWSEKPTNVMRCSWFYKGNIDARYVPYAESVAEKLEEEYHHGVTTGEWHRRLMLPNNEMVVMHGPAVMVHFLQTSPTDSFGSTPLFTFGKRVYRNPPKIKVAGDQLNKIDHLIFLVHGAGEYRNQKEKIVLPISWHSSLHSGETGVDRRLAAVTLESIPRLRNFTNDTILDVLFYTSPVYCQTIVDTVCRELNRIYELFKSRNPEFKGGVSLGGHSLGSVILYDLLCHQTAQELDINSSKQYVQGCAGTGQPTVKYPRLVFYPDALYALGSPIAIFECIRGVETLGKDFCLPTCKNFFNIFHPYDPIAYRLEPMINPSLRNVKPYLIPHHKGRKRMHLELKDTMARVGADIKQKLIESIRNTWTSMWRKEAGQAEVGQEEPEKEELTSDVKEEDDRYEATPEELGKLNGGRRVDHVLQEAPFEIFNEYLFAMTSHVCYWESEDTMLVMLREIYNALGVTPDCSLPQNTMTVERSRVTEAQDAKSDMSPEFPSTSRGSM
ncbi:triglyceride lipase, partial [Danaus plexippus plexippus]